jgi:hypothetical protein
VTGFNQSANEMKLFILVQNKPGQSSTSGFKHNTISLPTLFHIITNTSAVTEFGTKSVNPAYLAQANIVKQFNGNPLN